MPRRFVFVVALVMSILIPSIASASIVAGAENRILGIDLVVPALAWASSSARAEHHEGNDGLRSDAPSCATLAAEGAGGIKVGPADRPGGIGQGAYKFQTRTPTPDMLNQTGEHTCGVTCVRQTALDHGVADAGDAVIKSKTGYGPPVGRAGGGTTGGDMARALNSEVPSWQWRGGAVEAPGVPNEQVVGILSRPTTPSWMANLNGHWVMVDSFDGTVVVVRDPWGVAGPGSGMGARSTIAIGDFLDAWVGGGKTAVWGTK